MLTLDQLHNAAAANADGMADRAATLREREARDIANAIETKSSVGDGAWKDRWRAEVKARAAARVRDALQEVMEEEDGR